MSAGHKPDREPRILSWRDKIPDSLVPALRARDTHPTITMKQALTSDWGPTLYLWTAQLAEIIVAVYVAGLIFGAWLHRLNDRIARMVTS